MTMPTWMRLIFGTPLDDELLGSTQIDVLYGLAGNDKLYGKDGNDILYGGDGNDLLDGGTGRDVMFGGAGNDTYRIDNAGGIISETSVAGVDDGGIDAVLSTISYTLGNFLEDLTLLGNAALDGAGNELNNRIKGNNADNMLFGDAGSDTLYGGGGNDVLMGGLGRDDYYGGAGADTFVLKLDPGNWERIYDFSSGDKIGIIATDFGLVAGAGLTEGVLSADYFGIGRTATAVGHGQFLYDASKTELLWDPDGVGGAKATRIAVITADTAVTADQIIAYGATASASASIAAMETVPQSEDGKAYFKLTLSQLVTQDVVLTCSTVDGTAIGGQDFTALSSFNVTIHAGQTTVYLPVDLVNDSIAEGNETFSVRIDSAYFASSGTALPISVAVANAIIADEGPVVVGVHDMVAMGMIDPSAVAYNPFNNTLIMTDSEVDEAPFLRPEDMYTMQLDGTAISKTALPFTAEATGLAFNPTNHILYMTDDDKYKVIAVNVDNPTQVLWSFTTKNLGALDPEDIAVDTKTGNLFITNGINRTVVEVNNTGTTVINSFVLPTTIKDPEALAFDSVNDVFYIGGGFSDLIWKLDRTGAVIDVITALVDLRTTDHDYRVAVKDIELAPASDGSGEMHLFVADYGLSHVADGRLIEIDPGDTGAWAFV